MCPGAKKRNTPDNIPIRKDAGELNPKKFLSFPRIRCFLATSFLQNKTFYIPIDIKYADFKNLYFYSFTLNIS